MGNESVQQITLSSAPQQLRPSALQNIPTSVQPFMNSLATLCRISSAGMSLFENAQQFTTNNAPHPTELNAMRAIRKKSCSSDLLQLLQLLDFIVQALA